MGEEALNLLWIALGAATGGVMRYVVGGWAQQASGSASFPVGTLTVNLVGCLLIGLVAQMAESTGLISPQLRLLLITGFLGGFTTYSSFAGETLLLGRSGDQLLALLFVVLHLVLGLVAVWAGRTAVVLLWRAP
jgi:CrcB protein